MAIQTIPIDLEEIQTSASSQSIHTPASLYRLITEQDLDIKRGFGTGGHEVPQELTPAKQKQYASLLSALIPDPQFDAYAKEMADAVAVYEKKPDMRDWLFRITLQHVTDKIYDTEGPVRYWIGQ